MAAITEEFEEIVGAKILHEALVRFPGRYDDYSPRPDRNWSDYTAIDPLSIFDEHIDDIKRLSAVHNNDIQLQNKYMSMLFANVISAFEIFIADTLVQILLENEESRNRFLDSIQRRPVDKERLKDKYQKYWPKIIEIVYSITFSNSKKLESQFCAILDIEISNMNLQELKKASETRNDIMHRNGKNKKGEEISIDEIALEWCIATVSDIVEEVTLVDEGGERL